MKFGKQLRFVTVKSWYEHYIPYKELKKLIKTYENQIQTAVESGYTEQQIQDVRVQSYETFKETLIQHMNASIKYFCQLVADSNEKIHQLRTELDQELQELEDTERSQETATSFHKKIFVNMLNLYEVRSFLAINHTACHNIVKKFAKKVVYPLARDEFAAIEETTFANQPTIEQHLHILEECYVDVRRHLFPEGDKRTRQEIILELNKSVESSLLWKQSTVMNNWRGANFRETEFTLSPVQTKWIPIIVATIVLIPFQCANFFPDGKFAAQRCLGVLLFCSICWATAAVPLWLTSLSIPFLSTICQLIPGLDGVYAIAKHIQGATISPTFYLVVGGFTIAAGFKITEMDKRIAHMILSRSTSSVPLFVFSVIALNAFLAMWINNVASTMIVVTLITPTLNQLPTGSTFAKAILLGIAAGGNFGGMMTPLASPQNALAIQAYDDIISRTAYKRDNFGFAEFLALCFPTAALICALYWLCLIFLYKSDVKEVPKFQIVKTDFGWRQIVVSVTSVISIILWIVLPFGAEKVFGDNGIVGFIPLIVFYGTGILPVSEITQLPWNILFLVMGGHALGESVNKSGLLTIVSDLLQKALGGTSLWVSVFIVDLFVLVVNIFVSHTVSSTIIFPIISEFAYGYSAKHLRLFIVQACIATTCSQILPVSSFPNLCCVSLQDKNGKEFLVPADIMKMGSVATAVSFAVTISFQYGISIAYGL